MTGHRLLTIDQGKILHPVEVVLVSAGLRFGNHVRVCECGWIITARTDLEMHCRHTEHARAAAIARGWT